MLGALRVRIRVLDAGNHTWRGTEHYFVEMVVIDDGQFLYLNLLESNASFEQVCWYQQPLGSGFL